MEGRPSPCRFTPSCSQYAIDALATHGTARGLWLTVRRLLRCRPFGPSGWDPVPPATPAAADAVLVTDSTFTIVHRRHRHLHWRDSGSPA
jgi:putative membrane protein insertion efficiency factor